MMFLLSLYIIRFAAFKKSRTYLKFLIVASFFVRNS